MDDAVEDGLPLDGSPWLTRVQSVQLLNVVYEGSRNTRSTLCDAEKEAVGGKGHKLSLGQRSPGIYVTGEGKMDDARR